MVWIRSIHAASVGGMRTPVHLKPWRGVVDWFSPINESLAEYAIGTVFGVILILSGLAIGLWSILTGGSLSDIGTRWQLGLSLSLLLIGPFLAYHRMRMALVDEVGKQTSALGNVRKELDSLKAKHAAERVREMRGGGFAEMFHILSSIEVSFGLDSLDGAMLFAVWGRNLKRRLTPHEWAEEIVKHIASKAPEVANSLSPWAISGDLSAIAEVLEDHRCADRDSGMFARDLRGTSFQLNGRGLDALVKSQYLSAPDSWPSWLGGL